MKTYLVKDIREGIAINPIVFHSEWRAEEEFVKRVNSMFGKKFTNYDAAEDWVSRIEANGGGRNTVEGYRLD